jgi:pimeloyl-ACP methyl ester carboxylesterase
MLAQHGVRVIATADAHVCLLDALGIGRAAVMGGSAGAPSAMQMAGVKLVGFDQGEHTWVGHDDEVLAGTLKLLDLPVRP